MMGPIFYSYFDADATEHSMKLQSPVNETTRIDTGERFDQSF